MNKIFGIVGWSGSGKTDLICRLINAFKKSNKLVGSIKHTHHKFQIDKEVFNTVMKKSYQEIQS